MNFKTTYILFGVLIVALGVFLLTQILGKKEGEKSNAVFPSLRSKAGNAKADEIESVEIDVKKPKEEKIVLVRDGQGWRVSEPNVHADSVVANGIVRQLMEARNDDKAELTDNFKQFGLDAPSMIVTLTPKTGDKKWTLKVGDVGPGGFDALAYVNSSDRPKEVLAVRRGELEGLFKGRGHGAAGPENIPKSLADYRSKDLLPSNVMDIQSVSLQDGKLGPVVLKRTSPSDNRWVFEKPPLGEAEYGIEAPQGLPGQPPSPTQGGVQALLNDLVKLKVESTQDFVADNVTDLAKYGLDASNPERLRIEVNAQSALQRGDEAPPNSVTTVLLIGKKVEDKKPDEKKPDEKPPEDKDGMYYAALDYGNKSPKSVVKISGKLRDEIYKVLRNPNSLRSRDLFTFEPDKLSKVDWISIENGKETFQLRKSGLTWEVLDNSGKARKADGAVVERLLDLLKEKRQVRDFPEANKTEADLGLDKPTAVVSFYVGGVKLPEKKDDPKKDEKKDDPKKDDGKKDDVKKDDAKKDEVKKDDSKKDDAKKDEPKKDEKKEEKKEETLPTKPAGTPAIKLTFGKRDKELVYVLRELGDNKVRAGVSEGMLNRIQQDKLVYLDRSLPDFPRDQVNKVVIVRDGQTFELEKEVKDNKATWKFNQPEAMKGRIAESPKIVRILDQLSFLYADKLISETTTEGELERYGLKEPAIRATLTLKKDEKKTEDRVYLFGKESEDKSGRVHARMSEREWAFLVQPAVLAPLREELADTTIFTFAPEKVKTVKMTGWQAITGTPFKFDLEKKSAGGWTVKAPPDFKLDDARVSNLVQDLSHLKALKFVVLKSGPKPDQKLKIADGAVEIEVVVDGEKEPLILTIGALSSVDKGYFATSNRMPGDVFLLPESAFGEILKRPAYFALSTGAK